MLHSPQLSHSALCWRRAASYLLHRSCVEASAGLPVQARCRCGRARLSRRAPSACAGDQDHCRCGPGGPAKCWQEHSTPCHFSCTARGVTPLTCTSTVLHEQQWCQPATCYPQLTVLRVSSAWQHKQLVHLCQKLRPSCLRNVVLHPEGVMVSAVCLNGRSCQPLPCHTPAGGGLPFHNSTSSAGHGGLQRWDLPHRGRHSRRTAWCLQQSGAGACLSSAHRALGCHCICGQPVR